MQTLPIRNTKVGSFPLGARASTIEETRQQCAGCEPWQPGNRKQNDLPRELKTASFLKILLNSKITEQEKMQKHLLARVKELQDAMVS